MGAAVTAVLVPAGLEPLGVWDATTAEWARGPWYERAEWADGHLGDANFVYRAEFYLLDAPFAIVRRYAADGDGHKWAADGEVVTEPPVVVPLGELPPAHLLRQP